MSANLPLCCCFFSSDATAETAEAANFSRPATVRSQLQAAGEKPRTGSVGIPSRPAARGRRFRPPTDQRHRRPPDPPPSAPQPTGRQRDRTEGISYGSRAHGSAVCRFPWPSAGIRTECRRAQFDRRLAAICPTDGRSCWDDSGILPCFLVSTRVARRRGGTR